ncbi:sensor histidine kinase [Paraburkholderia strydomiana]|uniref:sensor histidine kinase n=1 Tax=Paraburkholderia strydomiana TaxID=1245417 RepID=UPI0038B93BCC
MSARLVPWRDGHRKTDGVGVTFVNITGLTQAEARQRVLIAELQHRTRNLLTVVQSIAQHTLYKGAPLDAFLMRPSALGRLQGLIGKAGNDLVALEEIVRLEFKALGAGKDEQIIIEGPPVALSLDRVHGIALALHQLATNAVKYGALKDGGGRLQVRWHLAQQAGTGPKLMFEWDESGLSVPPNPTRHGFGRKLIEHALAYTLCAKTELRFKDDGVCCRIETPLTTGEPPGENEVREGI